MKKFFTRSRNIRKLFFVSNYFLPVFLSIVFLLIVVIYQNPKLAIFVLIVIPLIILPVQKISKKVKKKLFSVVSNPEFLREGEAIRDFRFPDRIVVGSNNKKITKKIEDALKNNGSNKYFYGKDFNYLHAENNFIQYEDAKGSLILPQLNVLGEHQIDNITTAIMTARTLFNVKDDDIKKAIKK